MKWHQRAAGPVSAVCAVVLTACRIAGAQAPAAGTQQAWQTVRRLTDPPKISPELDRRIRQWVDDLGSDQWRLRDKATRELLGMGPTAKPIVKEARKRSDLEVRTRAEQILRAYESAERDRSSVLADALGVLARAGDKAVVDAMLKLLDHEDGDIRYAVEYGLRRWTGRRFGYRSDSDQAGRADAAKKWRAWWIAARATFTLPPASASADQAVLMCLSQEVRLVSVEGKLIWSKKLAHRAYSAQLLPNGNLITAMYVITRGPNNNRGGRVRYAVQEHDPGGNVVWSNKTTVAQRVVDFERLANGNTLMADASTRKIVEIDTSGTKVVWEYQCPGSVSSVQRLANGNTLIGVTSPGQVIEVDRKGKTMWAARGLGYTRHATKLANGNVLLVETTQRRVVEINRAGKTVWTWRSGGRGYPLGVCRLGNGATLVSDSVDGLVVVNRQGKIIRRMPGLRGSGTARLRLTPVPAAMSKGSKKGR